MGSGASSFSPTNSQKASLMKDIASSLDSHPSDTADEVQIAGIKDTVQNAIQNAILTGSKNTDVSRGLSALDLDSEPPKHKNKLVRSLSLNYDEEVEQVRSGHRRETRVQTSRRDTHTYTPMDTHKWPLFTRTSTPHLLSLPF